MCEFDTYIGTIIGSLQISKKKKDELADEFRDHLESLKSEFIQNGFSESESIKSAIDRFGESGNIKKRLNKSLFSLRNSGNVILGVIITLITLFFAYIPMAGMIRSFGNYITVMDVHALLLSNKWIIGCWIFFFIPVGYFLPIISNRVYKVLRLSLIFSSVGLLTGACLNIIMTNSVNVLFLLVNSASGMLGGFVGYAMLIVADKLNVIHKNKRVTTFSRV